MIQPKLGELHSVAGVKDAAHVAIITAKAVETIQPGARVYVYKDNWPEEYLVGTECPPRAEPNGILDPFLKSPVLADQYCCVVVLQFEDLRHHWECGAIEKPAYRKSSSVDEDADSWYYDECRECT